MIRIAFGAPRQTAGVKTSPGHVSRLRFHPRRDLLTPKSYSPLHHGLRPLHRQGTWIPSQISSMLQSFDTLITRKPDILSTCPLTQFRSWVHVVTSPVFFVLTTGTWPVSIRSTSLMPALATMSSWNLSGRALSRRQWRYEDVVWLHTGGVRGDLSTLCILMIRLAANEQRKQKIGRLF